MHASPAAPRHRSKTTGFTIIEVLVVTLIVGILLAVAMPTYRRYILRQKVTEVLMIASQCELMVDQFVLDHGDLNTLVGNHAVCANLAADKVSAINFTTYYAQYTTFQMTLSAAFDSQFAGQTIGFYRDPTPGLNNRWVCGVTGGGYVRPGASTYADSTSVYAYLPTHCRP